MKSWTFMRVALLAATLLIFGWASSVYAQAEAAFGTRPPVTCEEVTDVPSPQEAAALVQCAIEAVSAHDMVLLEDVKVQMGRPQAYNYNAHSQLTDIDTTAPVYPIRGSYVYYDCVPISVIPILNADNTGKNCHSVARPTAEGYCWDTTFGTWDCWMIDDAHNDLLEEQAPPFD